MLQNFSSILNKYSYYTNVEEIDCSPEVITYTDNFVKAIETIKTRHDPVVTTVGKFIFIIVIIYTSKYKLKRNYK